MSYAQLLKSAAAEPGLLAGIRALLDAAFDGEFSDDDWSHTVGGCHAVVVEGGRVVAHASVVARMLEVDGAPVATGYVEGVAAAPGRDNQGLGSAVMTRLGTVIRRDFDIGALSTDRHSFYERLGWERWQGPTFVRTRAGLLRTTDEDDGVMVLRFGATAHLRLTASISCDERIGDDW